MAGKRRVDGSAQREEYNESANIHPPPSLRVVVDAHRQLEVHLISCRVNRQLHSSSSLRAHVRDGGSGAWWAYGRGTPPLLGRC
jgi:hypothetical protein